MKPSKYTELGMYGGIFWRVHQFEKAGDKHAGHKHYVDHATLIAQGSVLCEIEGQEPREYHAPAVIEIDKDIHHQFTALEDGTVYFCVFAPGPEATQMDLKSMANGFCGSCSGCKPVREHEAA